MTSDIEPLFLYLCAICMFSLKKCLLKYFAHFVLIRLFIFFLLSFYSILYRLDTSLLSDIYCAHIFFQSMNYLLIVLRVFFKEQNF